MKPKLLNWANLATGMLLVYLVALLAGTHWPNLSQGPAQYNDKVAHYLAYAGLGLLVSFAWATRRPFTVGVAMALLAIVGFYGAMDELSQIPVPGRSGEVADWVADLLGGLTGILSFWLAFAVVKPQIAGTQCKPPATSEPGPEYSSQ